VPTSLQPAASSVGRHPRYTTNHLTWYWKQGLALEALYAKAKAKALEAKAHPREAKAQALEAKALALEARALEAKALEARALEAKAQLQQTSPLPP
jgi:hypothetical protein